jgi:para-aminobenzoate synthetase/4-amino-4-deoxychorismate lyase
MMRNTGDSPCALLFDARTERWLDLRNPESVIVARRPGDVIPAFGEAERALARGSAIAGFVSYDAAPGVDIALHAQQSSRVPLVWFGCFPVITSLERPAFPSGSLSTQCIWSPEITEEAYAGGISRVRNYLREGETYQVNFSFRLRSMIGCDPFEYFGRLMAAQPTRYSAFVDTGEFAICSASPELFFELEGDSIRCRPMKGTERRGRWYEEDVRLGEALRESEKNRAENVMIVDMVRNDLGRIAVPGSVKTESLFEIERFPGLWQMTSSVGARTNASVGEIMRALFPCASVTGAPKARTMQIIGELESSPRGLYTGAIGFVLPDRRAQFNVAIRTVVIDHDTGTAEYGTGGGVVWDSTAAGEYSECLLKAGLLAESAREFTLFETMLWKPGEGIALLERHLDRLGRSAAYFSFPFVREQILGLLEEHIRSFPREAQRVRLDLSQIGDVAIEHRNAANAMPDRSLRLGVSGIPVDSADRFLYHKTSRRGIYEDRKNARPDCDDVILLNERGEITETTIANIICELDGSLVTPSVSCGLLPGVFRESLLAAGTISERTVTRDDLERSARIYVCNALRGMIPVELVR